jgi:hypothetical protein
VAAGRVVPERCRWVAGSVGWFVDLELIDWIIDQLVGFSWLWANWFQALVNSRDDGWRRKASDKFMTLGEPGLLAGKRIIK